MPSIINATTTNGLSTSADNSGSLQLATNNGTTAVTIDTNQNVGIGVTVPSQPLVVKTDTDFVIGLGKTSAGTGARVGAYNAAINAYKDLVIDGATLNFAVSGGSPSMRIDASGRVTTATQPYCLVTPPNSFSVSAGAEILVNGTWTANTNTGNNFNTSGGIFTAPITGIYQIVWTVFFNSSAANRMDVFIYVNGTIVARKEQQKWATNNNNNSSQITATLLLAANDQVRFGVYSSSATTLFSVGQPWQYASIYLLG